MFKRKILILLVLSLLLSTVFSSVVFAVDSPNISAVSVDVTYVVDYAIPGDLLLIIGDGFGYDQGSVSFGFEYDSSTRAIEVEYWGSTYIEARIPEDFSRDDVDEIVIRVSSGLKAKTEFSIYQKLTEDPFSYYQRYLETIDMIDAWKLIDSDNEVVVAVVDSGIYQNHKDFSGRLWSNDDEIAGNNVDDDSNGYVDDFLGYNFVYNTNEITQLGGHGTSVAGIIGAIKDNNIGIAGIAENISLMPLIVCNDDGCSHDDIIEAIYYAVDNGADVINISIGSVWTNGFSTDYDAAVEYAYNKNVVIVAAAGNGDPYGEHGYDLDRIPNSPVCNDNGQDMVFGVGASTLDGKYRTNWSNYGSCVDIYAPGEEIVTTNINGDYISFSNGTSFSAPIVAGVAAKIISAYPKISNRAVYDYIKGNARKGMLDVESVFEDLLDNYSESDNFKEIEDEELFEDAGNNQDNNNSNPFSDLPDSHKNKNAILYLYKNGVINGYEDGTFRPENQVSRAELLKILIEGSGKKLISEKYSNCFTDVTEGWFEPYVCYAKESNWVSGYTDGSFKPEQVVSKYESIKMLLSIQEEEVSITIVDKPFEDVMTDEWYSPYISKAKNIGILEEIGTYFHGNDGMMRGGISENLYRYLTR